MALRYNSTKIGKIRITQEFAGEMDNPEAECLMQIIMFGVVIY